MPSQLWVSIGGTAELPAPSPEAETVIVAFEVSVPSWTMFVVICHSVQVLHDCQLRDLDYAKTKCQIPSTG